MSRAGRSSACLPRCSLPFFGHYLLVDTLQEHGVTAGITTVEDERAGLALVATGHACLLTADPHLAAAGVTRRPAYGAGCTRR